jgi:exoribonuclease R
MPDDHYVPDEVGVEAVGEDTGRRIRLGDPIRLRLVDVEPLRGRVTLEPAGAPRRRR